MGDLVVSAPGASYSCAAFGWWPWNNEDRTRGHPCAPMEDPRKPLAGIGAALFLLAFVASEAAATVVALRR